MYRDFNPDKDKAIIFFSASAVKDVKTLIDGGVREILVSYFYLKKRKTYYLEEFFPTMKKDDGVFMLDSGVHTFMNTKDEELAERMTHPDYWIPFIEEYTQFIKDYSQYIYCAANLDLDNIVGFEVVNEWNKKYFEPLEKLVNIIYVAHEHNLDARGDSVLGRFEYYAKKYQYIGVNQSFKKYAKKFYIISKLHGVKVHGFAWQSLRMLKAFPLFSSDSTSWLTGGVYGATFDYDGKNFRNFDADRKFRRKANKVLCEKEGIDFEGVLEDRQYEVNRHNILAWIGFRKEYLRMANIKLWNKPVRYYAKTKR